jgi:hypothetical protein
VRNVTRPRRRPLGAVRKLLTAMLTINVLVLIGAAANLLGGSNVARLTVSPDLVYGPQPHLLETGSLRVESLVVLVKEPTMLQNLLGLLSQGLAFALLALPMVIFARRLVDRAAANHPFTPDMVRGLRRLGAIVLIGGATAEVIRSGAALALYDGAVQHGNAQFDVNWMIQFWWLLVGLIVLGFAQVIEHGCTLRAELDEVI